MSEKILHDNCNLVLELYGIQPGAEPFTNKDGRPAMPISRLRLKIHHVEINMEALLGVGNYWPTEMEHREFIASLINAVANMIRDYSHGSITATIVEEL